MPLKKEDIEKFKKRLEKLQLQVNNSLRGVSEEVRSPEENKGYSQHQADEGTDDFARVISLGVSNTEMDILRQIERALEKIEEGTYGICDSTEKDIPKKRLEAIPYATRTAQAQDDFEKGIVS